MAALTRIVGLSTRRAEKDPGACSSLLNGKMSINVARMLGEQYVPVRHHKHNIHVLLLMSYHPGI